MSWEGGHGHGWTRAYGSAGSDYRGHDAKKVKFFVMFFYFIFYFSFFYRL